MANKRANRHSIAWAGRAQRLNITIKANFAPSPQTKRPVAAVKLFVHVEAPVEADVEAAAPVIVWRKLITSCLYFPCWSKVLRVPNYRQLAAIRWKYCRVYGQMPFYRRAAGGSL